jgi:transposase
MRAKHPLLRRDTSRRQSRIEHFRRLRHPLKELQRARFGRSSERLDPDQLQLALEEVEQALAQAESEIEKRAALRSRAAKPRSDERQSLPAHSPRIEVVITPEDTACRCCKGPMHVIGEETSERLGVIPAQYRVLVTRRLKYACRECANAIVQPSASERLIRGGLPTEAMVAHVLVSKYAWHLPLYRRRRGNCCIDAQTCISSAPPLRGASVQSKPHQQPPYPRWYPVRGQEI